MQPWQNATVQAAVATVAMHRRASRSAATVTAATTRSCQQANVSTRHSRVYLTEVVATAAVTRALSTLAVIVAPISKLYIK